MKKMLLSLMTFLLAGGLLSAQDFDLSAQRGESQTVNRVGGRAVAQPALSVNPTPQSLTLRPGALLDISKGFRLNDKRKAFAADVDFLLTSPRGADLTIDFGAKVAAKAGVKPAEGAYRLTVDRKGVKITGYDETGAFYGLQSLRRLLAQYVEAAELPQMEIHDWPALPRRGVVEGFYGTPWSHLVRLSLIDFYGKHKLNTYIYGPKDDPYHSSPDWRLPYPEADAQKIRELVDASRRARVRFVWAIHPGKDIRWDREDYDNLLRKLGLMYDLGVRDFALFFDDIEGEGTNPVRQAELVNNLTRDFVGSRGDVGPLMICPTDYSQMWANPGENGTLAVYGRELEPGVEVFWTGEVVCSDLTPQTLEFVDSRIKRPALFWWNFPVTDYCRNFLLQGPVYGLDTSLTAAETSGVVSNPMEHGEASKLALYGVADYAWNPAAYNPLDNWERGLRELMPDAAEAYRTFAIHNCDTETGYRRDESWETPVFQFNDYTAAEFDSLRAEFQRVEAAQAAIRASAGNDLLLREIEPWLVEFEKLGRRGVRTLDLIKTYEAGGDSLFWEAYVANLMTDDDRETYRAHKTGTLRLQPFYENAMDGMLGAFFERLTGEVPAIYKGVGTYANLRSTLSKLMTDGCDTTYYTSAYGQQPGDWIGLDLGTVRPVERVRVLQGRNSVDDVDFFDHVRLEASADGETWLPLTADLLNAYELGYQGEPVEARYVRLLRLDSKRRNWASVREFQVNPAPNAALDSNPATFVEVPAEGLTLPLPAGASEVILLLSNASGSNFRRISLPAGATTLRVDGPARLHEVLIMESRTSKFSTN